MLQLSGGQPHIYSQKSLFSMSFAWSLACHLHLPDTHTASELLQKSKFSLNDYTHSPLLVKRKVLQIVANKEQAKDLADN